MKREDFRDILDKHKKICEEVLKGRHNCKGIDCEDCMFFKYNSSNKKGCTDNQYSNPISQTYDDKLDILFVESCKLFFKTFFNVIGKEEVLKIESQEVFDNIAFRIVYQNEEVLNRDVFRDDIIGVMSSGVPCYQVGLNRLYIRSKCVEKDNKIILVSKEQFKEIENKVKLINEKYGIEKRWRAEKGEMYFYVNYELEVNIIVDDYYNGDNILYKSGNYFKTEEEAELVAIKFREVLKER